MNKNTKQARAIGYCSMRDANNDGNKIYAGSACDTAWNAKGSKKNSRKIYKRQASQEES